MRRIIYWFLSLLIVLGIFSGCMSGTQDIAETLMPHSAVEDVTENSTISGGLNSMTDQEIETAMKSIELETEAEVEVK